jgi:hypothetical protein
MVRVGCQPMKDLEFETAGKANSRNCQFPSKKSATGNDRTRMKKILTKRLVHHFAVMQESGSLGRRWRSE